MTTDAGVTNQPVPHGAAPHGAARPDSAAPAGPRLGAGAAGGARQRRSVRSLPVRDVAAIAVAGLGTLLLFVSLLVDWQRVVLHDVAATARLDAGIGEISTWGTAYVLGSMVLVALFVGVVVLPLPLGRAARVLGIAWTVILAGVVAAAMVRLAQRPADLNVGVLGGLVGGFGQAGEVTYSWGPGAYVASAALFAMGGAFAAACPALRDTDNRVDADDKLSP
ncbi:MAG TPA: hypothetical protein VK453_13780 [Micromonosporaceae bacterium]|nr:hypothetical protein [Micromonosporaceae bacterium]